jgi:hypothetical protein
MSVILPDELTWVLNLLGFMWPEADEDKLRACAQAWRDFGADVARINHDARLVATNVVADNTGTSIDAFDRYWHGVGGKGGDFDRAKEAAEHMAVALDGMATLVEGVKMAVVIQLGLLAAEIVADQVAAPVTLGLSEGAMVGEVIITRGIMRRIIREGIHRVSREIVQQLKGHVTELFRRILATGLRRAMVGATIGAGSDLAKQELDINVFHSRSQVDVTELIGASGTGALLGAVSTGRGGRTVINRHGYRYTLDSRGRPIKIEGWLTPNKGQGRNPAAQLRAGGKDRLPTDVGGHYLARIFDGPSTDFNHFAQDKNFNNGKYKALENKWQKALDSGKQVHVAIKPSYPKDSLRPHTLEVVYTTDGKPKIVRFMNRPGGV